MTDLSSLWRVNLPFKFFEWDPFPHKLKKFFHRFAMSLIRENLLFSRLSELLIYDSEFESICQHVFVIFHNDVRALKKTSTSTTCKCDELQFTKYWIKGWAAAIPVYCLGEMTKWTQFSFWQHEPGVAWVGGLPSRLINKIKAFYSPTIFYKISHSLITINNNNNNNYLLLKTSRWGDTSTEHKTS
jgi:hypothetical protein